MISNPKPIVHRFRGCSTSKARNIPPKTIWCGGVLSGLQCRASMLQYLCVLFPQIDKNGRSTPGLFRPRGIHFPAFSDQTKRTAFFRFARIFSGTGSHPQLRNHASAGEDACSMAQEATALQANEKRNSLSHRLAAFIRTNTTAQRSHPQRRSLTALKQKTSGRWLRPDVEPESNALAFTSKCGSSADIILKGPCEVLASAPSCSS